MSHTATKCVSCGEAILPQDKFCEGCGHPQNAAGETAPSPAAGDSADQSSARGGGAGDTSGEGGGNTTGDIGASEIASDRDTATSTADPPDGTTAAEDTPVPPPAPPAPPPPPAPQAPAPASAEGNCSFCGEAIHDEYCTACGAQRKFAERDRIELEQPGIAGVSDRGRKHTRNEDGMRFAAIPERNAFVAVVCDGMSTAQNSDIASQRACDAACTHLVEAVKGNVDLEAAMKEAGDIAQAAVCSVLYNKEEAARNERRCVPACTFTAAIAVPGLLVIGNIGDSRSYYVGVRNVRVQLSDDDSWAADQVRRGKMSESAAMAHKYAHSLMQWLGEDNEPVCGIKAIEIAEDGFLLLVSDGFWNYAMTPDAVATLVRKQPAGATPLQIARALTQFANDAGGHDNITIVVVPLPAS